jgi:mRNA interferase RelE/StbE
MEKYKIEIKKSAIKELNSIHQKDIRKIITKIQSLSSNPKPKGCTRLTNREDYRIRADNYKINYSVNDDILIIAVIKIGHRKEIYRQPAQPHRNA